MQTAQEREAISDSDTLFRELKGLIFKAGLVVRRPEGELSLIQKIQYRYFLLSTYYGDSAHYAVVALPLSRDYHRAVQASMCIGTGYQLPKFEPFKDRGLENVLGDLAILKNDMEFVPKELQEMGRQAINTIEIYLTFNQKQKRA